MKRYDFVALGSGIAGLSFALKAAQHGTVAIFTKQTGEESNTMYAQGGVACVTSLEDSFELHIKDTKEAGDGLCYDEAVRTVVSEGPSRIRELIELGVEFDERELNEGVTELDLGKEGGHSKRRVLHSRDVTGREIESKLLAAVRAHPNVSLFENHLGIDLITTGKLGMATANRCIGIYVLDEDNGTVETIRSDRIVLSTGGCGKVYLYTTNPAIATGDGVAMAWRAGATIANMEFIQFHPTCLYHPEARSFLITEALRGEGARLIDNKGREFMADYHERGAPAPRDVVARAIDAEMKRLGLDCVYLDISHQPVDFLRERFPNIFTRCHEFGIDIASQPIPVVPAAHYQCGGVKTDVNGRTSLRGLYAANRLASNSLLEAVVVAHRAHLNMLEEVPLENVNPPVPDPPEWQSGNVSDVDEMVVIYHNWDEIRRLMWDYVGIVRTDKRLRRAATRLRNLQHEIHEFYWNFKVTTELLELRNLVTVASLIVDSALQRKESRGLHYTLDYPQRDDEHFRKDTLIWRG